MEFKTLRTISSAIAKQDKILTCTLINNALSNETGKHWIRDLNKLKQVILTNTPQFKILAKDGNSKLPFLAFSSLPGVGHCPGAGDCLSFCYSFKAWRYPAAFCRQAQNSWLMQSITGWNQIANAIDQHKPDTGSIDFRLYVDGDFSSAGNVRAWFNILHSRSWLNTYGYSKSWQELLEYSKYMPLPDNYTLNLSSGSVHGDDIKQAIKNLSITRGEFIAVTVGYPVKNTMHNDREHQRRLRQAHGYTRKVFTCPGKCGSCTKQAHACGSDRFKGIDIIIAVH